MFMLFMMILEAVIPVCMETINHENLDRDTEGSVENLKHFKSKLTKVHIGILYSKVWVFREITTLLSNLLTQLLI